MRKITPLLCLILVIFSACSPTVYSVGSWVNKEKIKKHYDKVYIIALGQNIVNTTIVENDMAAEAARRSINTVRNTAVFTEKFINAEYGKEQVMAKVKELNCDAICTISILDVVTESRYVPGSTSYGYQPYPTYGYYNQFPGYYGNMYNQVTTPGYYVEDKTYYLECNLYDANTMEILFSIQSKAVDPTDIPKTSKAYTMEIFRTLEKEGVIKPVSSKKS